tara:strand:- start:727 stop:1566 length:840 start_codon:yes stop_codon:yes gene_type:complete
MDPFVTAVVLVSSLMHATWNAVVKGAEDGLVTQAAVVLGGALYAIPFLFGVPFPNAEAWIYLGLSALIHCAYFAALAAAYGFGDLGFIYPIARGSGPVLVAGLSALTIGELMSPAQFAGVSIICLGVLALAVTGRSGSGLKGFLFALAVACSISGYSLADGIGVRVSEMPFSYIPWLISVQAIPFTLFTLWRRGWRIDRLIRGQARTIWLGGFLIGGSYGMAMWAFYAESLSVVMALRETAVIFGAIIGAIVFKEAFGRPRILASILIASGAVWLNIAA